VLFAGLGALGGGGLVVGVGLGAALGRGLLFLVALADGDLALALGLALVVVDRAALVQISMPSSPSMESTSSICSEDTTSSGKISFTSW